MAGPLGGEFEKADVELSEHLAGVHPVDELRAAEAVQLITSKRQPAVLGRHRGVPRWWPPGPVRPRSAGARRTELPREQTLVAIDGQCSVGGCARSDPSRG